MNKDLEIWQFAHERLKRDESVMLLVVAESSGSSPGRQGFKMIVAADELCGSIGGGVMEVRLVELAKVKSKKAKGKSKSEIIVQVHRKNSPDSSGMICSGEQTVFIFKLNPSHLNTVREIIDSLENYQSKILRISDLEFELLDLKSDTNFKFERRGENEFVYQEKLGFKNKLYIIGGGHCALALSELMAKMDFYISLFDDREELNTLAKNEFVHSKTVIDSYENIGDFIESGANVYVVVMTLGYKFDEIVIRSLFESKFKYFGVLGSNAKMAALLRDLRKDGFDEEKIKSIRTPVGIEINSRTPEEIAVSIAAEIIMVKNK